MILLAYRQGLRAAEEPVEGLLVGICAGGAWPRTEVVEGGASRVQSGGRHCLGATSLVEPPSSSLRLISGPKRVFMVVGSVD
jgi:hypothetical protein